MHGPMGFLRQIDGIRGLAMVDGIQAKIDGIQGWPSNGRAKLTGIRRSVSNGWTDRWGSAQSMGSGLAKRLKMVINESRRFKMDGVEQNQWDYMGPDGHRPLF